MPGQILLSNLGLLASDPFGSEECIPMYGVHFGQFEYDEEYWASMRFPIAGTLCRFHVRLFQSSLVSASPGSGNAYRFTVYKNGASTGLTVYISDSETEESDDTHSVSVAVGDELYIRVQHISDPTQRRCAISLAFFPTTQFESVLAGSWPGVDANGNRWLTLTGFWPYGDKSEMLVPVGGTISHMTVGCNNAPGAGKSWTHVLKKNNVSTDLQVVISDSETEGSDDVHSIDVSPEDTLMFRTERSGIPAVMSEHIGVKRTGADNFIIGGTYDSFTFSYPNPGYCSPIGVECNSSGFTTAYFVNMMVNAVILKNLVIMLAQAPGDDADGIRAEVMKTINGIPVLTGFYAEVKGANTTGNSSANTLQLAKGELITLKWSRINNPDFTMGNWFKFGMLCESLVVPLGVVAPTVVTYPCTERTVTSTKANGEITSTGGYDCTRRGFCYLEGSEGEPDVDDDVEYEDGNFGAEAYSLDLTGLVSGSTYRIRAYAINPAGTAYGETVTCAVTVFAPGPSRVAAIRRIFRPGFYRMELALGDISFDADISQAAVKEAVGEVEGPTEPTEPVSPPWLEDPSLMPGFVHHPVRQQELLEKYQGAWIQWMIDQGMKPPTKTEDKITPEEVDKYKGAWMKWMEDIGKGPYRPI